MNAITADKVIAIATIWLRENACVTPEPDSNLKDLGLDSLDMVECTMAVEDKLKVVLHDEDIELGPEATFQEWAEAIALNSSK